MAYFRYTGDYYISPSGNDANSGTSPNAPFATIQAAFDAAGTTTNLTFVIGSGTYGEALVTSNTNNSVMNWTLQGDGEVIINGDGITETFNAALAQNYVRSVYIKNITFANWLYGFNKSGQNQNYFQNVYFTECKFININSMYSSATYNTVVYQSCTFIKSRFPLIGTISHYLRDCIFLNSSFGFDLTNEPTGYYRNGTNNQQNNGLFREMTDCIFANPFEGNPVSFILSKFNSGSTFTQYGRTFRNIVLDNDCVIQSVRYSNTDSSFLNYTQSATEFVDEINQYGTWLDGSGSNAGPAVNTANVSPHTILNYDLSFNSTTLTGSTDLFKTLGAPYSLDFNNTNYFNASQQPATRTIANQIPAIAYGTSNTATNAFHTAGGATWENIIETGSGFILSSSALISGSIESAVIDQGASKAINNIQFNWSTNDANQGVISYYTSSQIIQNYQLRYGNSTDLSSEEYKLFPLNGIPYLDVNGSGSGDNNFLTGSTDTITARYLQFKLTLRNNWNGG